MTRNTQYQLLERVTIAATAAALCFACGRSELEDQKAEHEGAHTALSMAEFANAPSLNAVRQTELSRISGSLPALNTQLIQQNAVQPSGPQLTEWTRSTYALPQLDFLPLIYFEAHADGTVERFMVHFDEGRIMKMQVWEAHDQAWTSIAHMQMEVKATDRDEPLAFWSDMIGAIELPNCRRNERDLWDCSVSDEDMAYSYYPRHLDKGEGPTDLVCMADCPNPNGPADHRYFDNVQDAENQSPFEVYVSYEYDPQEEMLYVEGQQVVPLESDAPDYVSGFMFRYEDKYIAEMACELDEEVAVGVCSNNTLPVFYTWTTNAAMPAVGRSPVR